MSFYKKYRAFSRVIARDNIIDIIIGCFIIGLVSFVVNILVYTAFKTLN